MMKLTIALIFAFLSTTVAHAQFDYLCNACLFPGIVMDGVDGRECDVVDGKKYPLRVDEDKKFLEWRGKKYSIVTTECAKYGWHAKGNGMDFDFCTQTQGGAYISDKDGNFLLKCQLHKVDGSQKNCSCK